MQSTRLGWVVFMQCRTYGYDGMEAGAGTIWRCLLAHVSDWEGSHIFLVSSGSVGRSAFAWTLFAISPAWCLQCSWSPYGGSELQKCVSTKRESHAEPGLPFRNEPQKSSAVTSRRVTKSSPFTSGGQLDPAVWWREHQKFTEMLWDLHGMNRGLLSYLFCIKNRWQECVSNICLSKLRCKLNYCWNSEDIDSC